MSGPLARWLAVPVHERVLIAIIAACLLLLGLTFLFALLTLVLRFRNVRRSRRWARLEAAWQGPVLDALTGGAPPGQVYGLVGPKERLYFVGYLVRFARRVRGDERQTLSRLAEPYLDLVARQIHGRRDAERRARAVQTLGLLAPERYAGTLLAALDDPSPLVAMVAARALCSQAHPEHAPPVLAHMDRFHNWDTAFLASMLADMGAPVAPGVVAALADDERPARVRTIAADALRRLNHLPAADVGAAVLATASDVDLLAATLRLLAHVGTAEHLPSVRRLIDHPAMAVRATAATALGRLGDRHDVGLLQLALDDPSIWVAMHAARAILAVGAASVLRATADSLHPRAAVAREALEGAAV